MLSLLSQCLHPDLPPWNASLHALIISPWSSPLIIWPNLLILYYHINYLGIPHAHQRQRNNTLVTQAWEGPAALLSLPLPFILVQRGVSGWLSRGERKTATSLVIPECPASFSLLARIVFVTWSRAERKTGNEESASRASVVDIEGVLWEWSGR